jgi:histidinol-phosphate aminotransferase
MYKIKDSISKFVSYKPNIDEYEVKLDANESVPNKDLLSELLSLDTINLYPDNYAIELRKEIASYQNVSLEEVMVGNGSSELLELVVKTFLNPNDVVLSIEPSFVMYEKYTMLSNGVYITVETNNQYETVVDTLIEKAQENNPKIIFLCTPNNPTGFMLPKEEVLRIVKNTQALVVVDEAYMEFADQDQSVISEINNYSNLIVNRTFSKAFGIAGARLGYFIANKELIDVLSIAKTPYGVNEITQQLGILALKSKDYLTQNILRVSRGKAFLEANFNRFGITFFKTEANFFFIQFTEFDLAKELKNRKVLIRKFKGKYEGTYRITIGTDNENNRLIKELEDILYEKRKS